MPWEGVRNRLQLVAGAEALRRHAACTCAPQVCLTTTVIQGVRRWGGTARASVRMTRCLCRILEVCMSMFHRLHVTGKTG